ncbi:MAG: zinc-finger domain-containing protein [Pseudomonadota bacterium]|nr:zinc-finger domain-containing protein [Pseudomonadota bacterium]
MCPEQVKTSEPVISCDGGGGSLGHPMVYLNTQDKGGVDCPYCGRRYIFQPISDEKVIE